MHPIPAQSVPRSDVINTYKPGPKSIDVDTTSSDSCFDDCRWRAFWVKICAVVQGESFVRGVEVNPDSENSESEESSTPPSRIARSRLPSTTEGRDSKTKQYCIITHKLRSFTRMLLVM